MIDLNNGAANTAKFSVANLSSMHDEGGMLGGK